MTELANDFKITIINMSNGNKGKQPSKEKKQKTKYLKMLEC